MRQRGEPAQRPEGEKAGVAGAGVGVRAEKVISRRIKLGFVMSVIRSVKEKF